MAYCTIQSSGLVGTGTVLFALLAGQAFCADLSAPTAVPPPALNNNAAYPIIEPPLFRPKEPTAAQQQAQHLQQLTNEKYAVLARISALNVRIKGAENRLQQRLQAPPDTQDAQKVAALQNYLHTATIQRDEMNTQIALIEMRIQDIERKSANQPQ